MSDPTNGHVPTERPAPATTPTRNGTPQPPPLTAQQEQFCRLRVADPTATGVRLIQQIDAYKHKSHGMQTNYAHQMNRNPAVRARIRALIQEAIVHLERKHRYKFTTKTLIHEELSIARARVTDILSVVNGRVTIKDSSTWDPRAAAAVESVENSPDGVKVKFYRKPDALRRLEKIIGLVRDDPTQPGGVTIGRVHLYIPSNGRALQSGTHRQLDVVADPFEPTPTQEDHSQ